MAAGIDVFFTGLMLICLKDETVCPPKVYKDGYHNTAAVVKADASEYSPLRVCGWYSMDKTHLELEFRKSEFNPQALDARVACKDVTKKDVIWTTCALPEVDICLDPSVVESGLAGKLDPLPRLDEIDRRFLSLDQEVILNTDYVPAKIYFKNGDITADQRWPVDGNPTRWYRSDGDTDEAFPRALTSRLKASYNKAAYLTLTDCTNPLIKLVPKDDSVKVGVVLQNVTEYPPTPDYDEEGEYETLTYLLWYYRLGSWDTSSQKCPHYTRTKKDAVLLQCVSKTETGCVHSPYAASDTRFWPPMLGPRPPL